jgi:hypothetical protein
MLDISEILFSSVSEDATDMTDVTEEQARDNIKKHHSNVDLKHVNDGLGIFAVPNGQPTYRFNMPIISGHIYERKILDMGLGLIIFLPIKQ